MAATSPQNHRDCGFTLLEILVAVAVFAILAVMSFGSLNTVLTTREHTAKASNALHKLQLGMTIMQRDFSQIINTTIRDEYGDKKPSVVYDGSTDYLIEIVRGGWSNPTKLPRSNLQRVAYSLDKHILYREYWTQINSTSGVLPQRSKLFENIDSVEFEFADKNLRWHEQWPPINLGDKEDTPNAIRLKIITSDGIEITRLFDIIN